MEEIIKKYTLLNHLNVSRETCLDFEKFISMIKEKNSKINIISKKTFKNNVIRERHIIDTAQAIDFVDLNSNTTSDLGSGGGFPGIVIAIMLKNLKKNMKLNLYEKSHHKSNFLREVSSELNLDTEIIQKDIFETNELNSGTIMARAFKPLPVILELIHSNAKNWRKIFIFLGKTGDQELLRASNNWDIKYKQNMSITNSDSKILEINKLIKK